MISTSDGIRTGQENSRKGFVTHIQEFSFKAYLEEEIVLGYGKKICSVCMCVCSVGLRCTELV